MYKNSSDKQNFVARTGSHSTKESRTGLISAIPSWAQEPEDYYNSLRDRWQLILNQLMDTQTKLADINAKLRVTLPRREFEHLRQHKERLADHYRLLSQQQNEYRPLVRAAAERAWSVVFYHAAKTMLPPDDFRALDKEVQKLLARGQKGIKKGYGEYSDEQRANMKRSQRRQAWGKYRQSDGLVWGDNGPVKKEFIDQINRDRKSD